MAFWAPFYNGKITPGVEIQIEIHMNFLTQDI